MTGGAHGAAGSGRPPKAGGFAQTLAAIHHAGPWKRLRRRMRTWRSGILWSRRARPVPRPVSSRVIVSLTTSPLRIKTLDRVVRTLLNQSCAPDEVHLNIPHVFRRTGEGYVIPEWCRTIDPRVKVFRVDDAGPATKSLPTIFRYGPGEDVVIVFVDDDILYLQRTLEVHLDAIARDRGCVYGFTGYDILPGHRLRHGRGNVDVEVLEGWGSIAFHRSAVGEGLEAYVEAAHRSRACFAQDDYTLSNWFALRGVRRRVLDDPRASFRMMRARGAQLDIGYLDDAIHRGHELDTGLPLLRHPEIEAHLRSVGMWALGRAAERGAEVAVR